MRVSARGQYPVNNAVVLGFGSRHEIVPLGVFLNFLQRLPCALSQNAVHLLFGAQNITSMNFNIRCLPVRSTQYQIGRASELQSQIGRAHV